MIIKKKSKKTHEYILCYQRNNKFEPSINARDINTELSDTIRNSVIKNGAANPPSIIELPVGFPCEVSDIHLKPRDITCMEYLDDLDVVDGKLEHSVKVKSGWSSKNILQAFIDTGCNNVFDSQNQVTTFYITKVGNIFYEKQRQQSHVISVLRNYGTTHSASSELGAMGIGYFSFPKPVGLLKYLSNIVCNNDSIILDFFAGSDTTGHAVMDLNAEDGGNRKYILVQLDEKTDEKSEAKKAGYDTIDQITAERLRRAGDKIKKEHPEAKIDTGFRVFRIDSANDREEIRKPASAYDQSELFKDIDNIKPDRTPLDLLFGAISHAALPLDLKLETRQIGDNTIYLYGYLDEGTGLVACFDEQISDETVKEIAKLKSLTAVFRDSSFPDSATKINLSEHFRILSPDTKIKVL